MKSLINVLLLIFAASVWGLAFVATKWILIDFSPLWTNALRFALAGLFGFPLLLIRKTFFNKRNYLKEVFLCSFFLFLSLMLLTFGLQSTTVAKSGFIACFYVFFTPLLCMIFRRKRYQLGYWFLVVLSLVGVFLLCDLNFKSLNWGDFLVFIGAFFGAMQILAIDKITKVFDSGLELNALQCFFVGVLGVFGAYFWEGPVKLDPLLTSLPPLSLSSFSLSFIPDLLKIFSPSSFFGLIVVSLFSTFLAFAIQAHSQKFVSPHIVSLVFLLEAPFAGIFGFWFLGEKFSFFNLLGCAIIFMAVALIPFWGKEIRET